MQLSLRAVLFAFRIITKCQVNMGTALNASKSAFLTSQAINALVLLVEMLRVWLNVKIQGLGLQICIYVIYNAFKLAFITSRTLITLVILVKKLKVRSDLKFKVHVMDKEVKIRNGLMLPKLYLSVLSQSIIIGSSVGEDVDSSVQGQVRIKDVMLGIVFNASQVISVCPVLVH